MISHESQKTIIILQSIESRIPLMSPTLEMQAEAGLQKLMADRGVRNENQKERTYILTHTKVSKGIPLYTDTTKM